jgi:hypothetical protein
VHIPCRIGAEARGCSEFRIGLLRIAVCSPRSPGVGKLRLLLSSTKVGALLHTAQNHSEPGFPMIQLGIATYVMRMVV